MIKCYKIFKQNAKLIDQTYKQGHKFKLGFGPFTDLSTEFSAKFLNEEIEKPFLDGQVISDIAQPSNFTNIYYKYLFGKPKVKLIVPLVGLLAH